MSLLGYTRVPKTTLQAGHLYWINDDKPVDLGTASLEDFKLLAFVAQEAATRMRSGGRRGGKATLGRVWAFASRLHDRAKAVDTEAPV